MKKATRQQMLEHIHGLEAQLQAYRLEVDQLLKRLHDANEADELTKRALAASTERNGHMSTLLTIILNLSERK